MSIEQVPVRLEKGSAAPNMELDSKRSREDACIFRIKPIKKAEVRRNGEDQLETASTGD